MMTSRVTIAPVVESDCPACGHYAARRAEPYQTVYSVGTVLVLDWHLLRCRCGHKWLTPQGSGPMLPLVEVTS